MSYQDPNNPNQFNPNPYNPNPFQSPQQFSGYQPQPFYGPNPYQIVQGPATALLVFGIVGLVIVFIILGLLIFLLSILASGERQLNEARKIELYANLVQGAFSIVIGTISSIVIVLGSLKMKKLQNMGLAKTAAILAMIPCTSICCIVGLPIGIWALNVLDRPEVKASFR